MRTTVTALGITGRDPELKFAKSGKAWVKFPIAVTERVKDGDEWVDGNTTWFDVYAWGSTAESVADNVTKGMRVLVTGTFKRSDWEMEDGTPKVTLEISAEHVGIAPFPNRGGGQQRGGGQRQPRRVQRNQIESPPF